MVLIERQFNTKFWNDADLSGFEESIRARFVGQCAWLSLKRREWWNTTDVAPADCQMFRRTGTRREFVRASCIPPMRFILVDSGRARRGAVFLEIRQKCVAADYCAAVLLSPALV